MINFSLVSEMKSGVSRKQDLRPNTYSEIFQHDGCWSKADNNFRSQNEQFVQLHMKHFKITNFVYVSDQMQDCQAALTHLV